MGDLENIENLYSNLNKIATNLVRIQKFGYFKNLQYSKQLLIQYTRNLIIDTENIIINNRENNNFKNNIEDIQSIITKYDNILKKEEYQDQSLLIIMIPKSNLSLITYPQLDELFVKILGLINYKIFNWSNDDCLSVLKGVRYILDDIKNSPDKHSDDSSNLEYDNDLNALINIYNDIVNTNYNQIML